MHMVYSPQDKKNLEEKINIISNYLDDESNQWMISYEKGSNKDITHLDIILWLKKPQRSDKVNDKLRRKLGINNGSMEYRIALKTYGIEDDNHLRWYVGYNRKEEGDVIFSELYDVDLKDCIKYYNEHPDMMNKKRSNIKWSMDAIIIEYKNYCIDEKKCHNEENLKYFLKMNIDKILPSQLQKMKNNNAMIEYLELSGVEIDSGVRYATRDQEMATLGLIQVKSNGIMYDGIGM